VRDYRYNAAERLTEIDDNGQAIGRYRYDPMGRRVYKETATETTWFIYADEGLIAELQADGTLKRGYGWKPQGLWGTDPLWLAEKTGAGASDWSTHVYHNDHLWTPQRLTDSAGVVSWSGRSEAFGLTTATVNIVDNPLRFPGQYEDDAGFHHNWNRDYLSSNGRYLQGDPIGMACGSNLYAYALSNPILVFDETGEHPILWAVAAALSRALQACARNMVCRCRAYYAAYRALKGWTCISSICKIAIMQAAVVSFRANMRVIYLAQGCDRVIPTPKNHPKAAAEDSAAARNCWIHVERVYRGCPLT